MNNVPSIFNTQPLTPSPFSWFYLQSFELPYQWGTFASKWAFSKANRDKKYRLSSYDTNKVMVSSVAMNQESKVAFQDFMETSMEVEKDQVAKEMHHYLMFLFI